MIKPLAFLFLQILLIVLCLTKKWYITSLCILYLYIIKIYRDRKDAEFIEKNEYSKWCFCLIGLILVILATISPDWYPYSFVVNFGIIAIGIIICFSTNK